MSHWAAKGIGNVVVQHDCIAFAAAIMGRSPESAVPTAPDYELSVLSECCMRLLLLSAIHLPHAACPLPASAFRCLALQFAVWHNFRRTAARVQWQFE